jgi:RNA polymerase sigma-70 factor (ECF subfamily)
LQDTFLRLWNRAPVYDDKINSLLPWLFCVGRNGALDYLRKESRRGAFDVIYTEEFPDFETLQAVTVDPSELDGMRMALAALPPEQRELIELAYFEGLTHSELAERTGQSLGTVKSRIRLGLGKLRTLLTGRQSELSL